jgi:RimJ/RimL family protein N-acetyltransferase
LPHRNRVLGAENAGALASEPLNFMPFGYEKIFTYVRGDNPAALVAYVKCGFRIVGTAQRHAKCAGRYVDEIIIERFL